ncbi:MAG TPA: hypothetical protein VF950_16955 [Planctomycetota bacterium]
MMTDDEARRPGALPELIRRLKNPGEPDRDLIARLIGVAGGQDAVAPLMDALQDEDIQVAWRALDALEALKDLVWPQTLLKAFDLQAEPRIRGGIALLYGKLEGPAKHLRERLDDSASRGDVVAALARLGDEEARAEFGRKPSHALFEYVRGPWLLKHLLPLLDDEKRMVQGAHVATDNECREIGGKRMCDLAVEEAAVAHAFSFEVPQMGYYTPAQIDEVRRFLRGSA